jgi:hypothetical protein
LLDSTTLVRPGDQIWTRRFRRRARQCSPGARFSQSRHCTVMALGSIGGCVVAPRAWVVMAVPIIVCRAVAASPARAASAPTCPDTASSVTRCKFRFGAPTCRRMSKGFGAKLREVVVDRVTESGVGSWAADGHVTFVVESTPDPIFNVSFTLGFSGARSPLKAKPQTLQNLATIAQHLSQLAARELQTVS